MCADAFRALIAAFSYDDDGFDALLHADAVQNLASLHSAYVATRRGVLGFLQSLGSLLCQQFDILSDVEQDNVLKVIAEFVLNVCSEIDELVAV